MTDSQSQLTDQSITSKSARLEFVTLGRLGIVSLSILAITLSLLLIQLDLKFQLAIILALAALPIGIYIIISSCQYFIYFFAGGFVKISLQPEKSYGKYIERPQVREICRRQKSSSYYIGKHTAGQRTCPCTQIFLFITV